MTDTDNVNYGFVMTDLEIPADTEVNDDFQFDTDEGMRFAPRITPGTVTFRFEPTRNEESNGKRTIEYTAHVQVKGLAPARILRTINGDEAPLNFQRASDFKSPAMRDKKIPSDMERLYSALGLVATHGKPTSKEQMFDTIYAAAGAIGKATIIWKAVRTVSKKTETSKAVYETFSTSPNVKKGEKPWPRAEDGSLLEEVTFADGSTKMGREEIGRLIPAK